MVGLRGRGTNYEIGMRTRTILSNRVEGNSQKIGEIIGLEDRCWSVNPGKCTVEITRERERERGRKRDPEARLGRKGK